jgi:hypothetical protein
VSQVHRTSIAQPNRVDRTNQFVVAIAAIALAAAAMIGIVVSRAAAPAAVKAPAAHEALVDGWQPAARVAGAARIARIQDGYLSGLVNVQRGDLADGYLSGLVGSRQGGDLTDGYLPGLTAASNAGDLVDGWLPSVAGRGAADLRDGWESSLTR